MVGELLAILAVLTFVVSNVLYRKTERYASPIFINFFRTALGTITFFLVAVVLGILPYLFLIPWELWAILFVSFLFGQVIGDTAYFIAQKELGTTIALAVSMTFPLFTFILSLIFLNRPFEIKMILSLIFIGLGIIIIGKYKIKAESNNSLKTNSENFLRKKKLSEIIAHTSIKAIGYSLAASLGWAAGLVILDYTTNKIDLILNAEGVSSIISNVIRFPFALAILILMVWRENNVADRNQTSSSLKKTSQIWLILLLASIIGTSLGAYLYTEATRTAGANVMSLLASTSPLLSLPITYWVNKEKISIQSFLGIILTIIGIIFILI
jgi:drug/metabolite transporter (DMT)-like permease